MRVEDLTVLCPYSPRSVLPNIHGLRFCGGAIVLTKKIVSLYPVKCPQWWVSLSEVKMYPPLPLNVRNSPPARGPAPEESGVPGRVPSRANGAAQAAGGAGEVQVRAEERPHRDGRG